jgi:hypothetical protein
MGNPMTAVDEVLLTSLRALGGKATVGDLAQRSALPSHEVEARILGALSHVGGHVAVDDHGNLVYSIERSRPLPTFRPPLIARIFALLYAVFKTVFFAALSIALVMYFTVYVVIILAVIIAGIAAAAKGGDCDCACDCKVPDCSGCGGCDGCVLCCDGNVCHGFNRGGDNVYGKTVGKKHPERMDERAALRKAQAERRDERQREKLERSKKRAKRLHNAMAMLGNRRGRSLDFPLEVEVMTENPPFFRAVRDFVFGPPSVPVSASLEYQNLLGFIRDHDGRITATDAVLLTGLPLDVADRMLLELAVQHNGDVEASEEGVVVYRFDRFMVSVGADLGARRWIEQRDGKSFSIEEFATQFGLKIDGAKAQVAVLAEIGGVTPSAEGRYRFGVDALKRLAEVGDAHAALRNYNFAWERLERAPAIIGVPVGKRGWIYGFNALNLLMSLILLAYYSDGERLVGPAIGLMSEDFELWSLGILPCIMSLGVFIIPLVRAIVVGLADGARKRRNTRRVILLGLAHCLMDDAVVTAAEIRRALSLDAVAEDEISRYLTTLGVELEATLSKDAELSFDRAHRELRAVSVAAEVDPSAFALKPIVYDTAKPM